MSALVLISDMKYPQAANDISFYDNYPARGGQELTPLQVANLPRPKEILALVDALTAMFKRIGMAEMCQACWAGELQGQPGFDNKKGLGCCHTCSLVGHTACLAKPLGCAFYMCSATQDKFPSTREFLRFIRTALYVGVKARYNVTSVYLGGPYIESRLRLSRPEQKLLRVLACAVNSWGTA